MDLCHVQSDNCQGWSPTIPKGWSTTNLKMVTHQKEVCYRLGIWRLDLNKKLRAGDNCQEWSPTILRMVTLNPKHGHPP